jgi:two-component system chemotaxis sensor kinase CheA
MSELTELLAEYVAETTDTIEALLKTVDQLLDPNSRANALVQMSRGIHTVKGSSSMFGFENTKNVAHELEDYLAKYVQTPELVNDEVVARIKRDLKIMEELVKSRDSKNSRSVSAASNSNATSSGGNGKERGEEYVRVPVRRLNETLNGISEIFLVRNQMVYLIEKFKSGIHDPKDFLQNWEILDTALRRGIGDVERSTMSMRMMAVQGLFSRINRVVDDYVAKSGKKIALQIIGDSTELDKKVLDVLAEPLVHLIRNAMDHGIETPDERLAADKHETGRIQLSAHIAGNEVIIRIQDDGKGINPKGVLAAARRKGIDVSSVIDDASAIDLIFVPGFSTSDTVTDVSGRGIGMDAVRNSVQSLGGRISIDTHVGKGTTFTVHLPVSMSLIPVVLTEINGLTYAIANHEILETKRIPLSSIKKNSGGNYVHFRGEFIQCIDLQAVLDKDIFEEIAEDPDGAVSVMIFNHQSRFVAASVGKFQKNMEIVVKPPSRIGPKIPYIGGVSVLPTGEPIFVLSLGLLFETFFSNHREKDKGAVRDAA